MVNDCWCNIYAQMHKGRCNKFVLLGEENCSGYVGGAVFAFGRKKVVLCAYSKETR